MCELIGRMDADPDVLPRTENFGVDYIAFSAMCPQCPPDFLKLTYNCVKVILAFQEVFGLFDVTNFCCILGRSRDKADCAGNCC